jgi:hypothetical protein
MFWYRDIEIRTYLGVNNLLNQSIQIMYGSMLLVGATMNLHPH